MLLNAESEFSIESFINNGVFLHVVAHDRMQFNYMYYMCYCHGQYIKIRKKGQTRTPVKLLTNTVSVPHLIVDHKYGSVDICF